jgi:hypothetical protein
MPRAGQLAVVLVAVAVVVAVFLLVRPSDEQTIDTGPASAGTTEPDARERPSGGKPRSETGGDRSGRGGVPLVTVVDGEPKGGPLKIDARRGDAVAFEVESDSADEVHVHGYELYEDVEPGRPATFDFDADLEGIYEVELHGAGTRIAELRVSP